MAGIETPALAVGTSSWAKGFMTSSQTHAQSRAAIELLILEDEQGSITPEDAKRITHDPISGGTFVYDPASRTLSAPESSQEYSHGPITLPW